MKHSYISIFWYNEINRNKLNVSFMKSTNKKPNDIKHCWYKIKDVNKPCSFSSSNYRNNECRLQENKTHQMVPHIVLNLIRAGFGLALYLPFRNPLPKNRIQMSVYPAVFQYLGLNPILMIYVKGFQQEHP